MQIQKEIQLC